MRTPADPGSFWNEKILAWEESRYGSGAPSLFESAAGKVSSSLRFRTEVAMRLLAPSLAGRAVIELGCGSGRLAKPVMALGAARYHGIDISERAIDAAIARHAGLGNITFEAAAVTGVGPTGDALVFSLGLFDWLSPPEIDHVFAIARHGSYLHSVSERRMSPQQLVHRLYVHLAYGHRSGGYVPQYHTVAQMAAACRRNALPEPGIFRHRRLRFGIFVTDLPLAEHSAIESSLLP